MKKNLFWKLAIVGIIFYSYQDSLFAQCGTGNPVQNATTTVWYPTIQAAINAASAGDVISVCPGTYAENVVVNQSVTIQGAGQANTFVIPAVSDPNTGGGSLPGSNVFLVEANNVRIHDLTINGDNPSLTSAENIGGANIDARNGIITNHFAGSFSNLEIDHVTVKNIWLRGIYASSGGSFNIHHNTVSNVQADYASIGIFNWVGTGSISNNNVSNCNDAISSNHSSGTVYSGNTVSNSGSGIHTDNNGDSGGFADIISNNTISNSPANGYGIFVYAAYRDVIVEKNTITNVEVGLTCAGSYAAVTPVFRQNSVNGMMKANSIGVYSTTEIWGYLSGNQNATFTNNYIQNNLKGFLLASEAGYTNSTNANENSVTGNATFVKLVNDYTETPPTGAFDLDMTCNYWGTVINSQINSKIIGAVTYAPYLTNSTDFLPAVPGFQPVPGSCNSNQVVECGNNKIIICHNGKSQCISENALQAHLNHGDVLGPCPSNRGTQEVIESVEVYRLSAAPNPAYSTTMIKYELPVDSKVNLSLFDVQGKVVRTLVEGLRTAGVYNYVLDVTSLPAGIYYYKMTAVSGEEKFAQGQKLIIIR